MFPTMWSALDKNKNLSPEEFKKIQPFMFCKWLSGDYRTLGDANFLNLFYDIPVENQYMLIKHKHAGKIRNIKYIKSDKDDIDKIILEIISKHYKISEDKAKEYLVLISEEELNYLKELYKERK